MWKLLNIITATAGLCAAVFTIILFFHEKRKRGIVLFIVIVSLCLSVILSWSKFIENASQERIEKTRQQDLIQDARIVSDAIVISGWEDVGDYIGYLTMITGFYDRHRDVYRQEYESYSRELAAWQSHLQKLRESGKTLYSSDIEGLEGLVSSGEDHLERISTEEQ